MENRANRPTRIPFSANNQKMQVEYKDPDFFNHWVPRWFNDQRGRVQRAQTAGYEFVEAEEVIGLGGQDLQSNTDLGTKVSMVVTGPVDGNPEVRAYLMKIRKDWYAEDQGVKARKRRESERAVYEGNIDGAAVENRYGEIRSEIKGTA